MPNETQDPRQMSAEGRYESLSMQRSGPLQRARLASELTIPGIMPPEGASDSTELSQPFQSVGARGVNITDDYLMGSIAHKVTRYSECSVLLTRPE